MKKMEDSMDQRRSSSDIEVEEHPPKPVSDKDEEGEEEDEDADRTRFPAGVRKQINAPGKAPEAGIIKYVYVENFMCHQKFKVDLCRNVNFITGQNGSGKSAILAAIQICLGAGARRTHRARNLKDLVRKDAAANAPTQAKIRVSLLNKGSDAYKPEIYGETIVVERTISLKGGYNGYKLYDENMVEKSRSKKDLDALLDQL
jgi:predicted ATPase